MDLLNERFEKGHPSNDLGEAGVLVRQFDGLDGHSKPWLPCAPFTGMPTDMGWCHQYADRWPASVVNPQTRMLYYGVTGIGGLVISPTVDLFCAYSGDGNSMGTVRASALTWPPPTAYRLLPSASLPL